VTDAELMAKFCSVGGNCEFGIAQQHFGASPLDLLRFTWTPASSLKTLLEQEFADLAAPDSLRVIVPEAGIGSLVANDRLRIHWHAWHEECRTAPEKLIAREVRRVPRLVSKLIDELREAERIFVRVPLPGETLDDAFAILGAMRRYGNGVLVAVAQADEHREPGTIERHGDLICGYIDGLTEPPIAGLIAYDSWIRLCRAVMDALTAAGRSATGAYSLDRITPVASPPAVETGHADNPAPTEADDRKASAERRRLDSLITRARQSLDAEPGNAHLWTTLGNLLIQVQDLEGARQAFQQSLALKPAAAIFMALAQVLARLGRADEAIDPCLSAMRLDPDHAGYCANAATMLASAGRLDEAEASYRRALELAPQRAELHIGFSHFLIRHGRIPEATAAAQQAVDLAPDRAAFRYHHGTLLAQQNLLVEAGAALQRAVALDPAVPQYRDRLAHVESKLANENKPVHAASVSSDHQDIAMEAAPLPIVPTLPDPPPIREAPPPAPMPHVNLLTRVGARMPLLRRVFQGNQRRTTSR
jgi:tetratricopeptide (TPR) repeat protein